jgi:hypothetical protein
MEDKVRRIRELSKLPLGVASKQEVDEYWKLLDEVMDQVIERMKEDAANTNTLSDT